MSLRFCDGFDHYTSVQQALGKWTGAAGITPGVAGHSGLAMQMQVAGNAGTLSKSIDHQAGWTVGFDTYFSVNTSSSVTFNVVPYTTKHNDQSLTGVKINTNATISIVDGNNTGLSTSAITVVGNKWQFIEYSYSLSGTTPILVTGTVKLNGVAVTNVSGASTGINQSQLLKKTTTVNRHQFAGVVSSYVNYMNLDNLYILDNQNVFANNPNTSFLGVVTVSKIMPAADTAQSGWTPNSGGVHFNRVNEIPPDDDTTYLSASAAATSDLWVWQPIGQVKIFGIQISMDARKDDEGSKSFLINAASNALSTTSSGPTFYVDDQYTFYSWTLDGDPATTNQWTRSGLNAARFGPKLVA